MVNPDHTFHIADYCVFGVTIVVSLGIGLYYALSGGKQKTTAEYFVGNRKMTILPVAISLLVSFESSIMMLGTPAEVYYYGFQWFIGCIGFFVAQILSIIVAVPLIHPLKITSAYEYLELRFNSHAVRILGTILGMMSYCAYMGIVLFGPAIALEGVTGFPQWGSIVSVAAASVIYTAIGGIKAVIWTDVFQAVVMFSGCFAVLVKGTMQVGGIGRTWEIANDNGRLNIFNFDPDPTVRHTFWNLFIGSIIRGFGLVFNQSSIQRISSTPTIRDARRVLIIVAPAFFFTITFAGIEGIVAYAYYDTLRCDPLKSGQITNPNQIIPYMVMDIFQGLKGMPGLFMASLFSASLSTLSSGLSSLSALFWTDLIKPHFKPMSEFKSTIISKLSVVFFGIVAVVIAFMIALIGGTLVQISGSLLAAFGGPLTGLFLLGAFCPWANAKGAIGGTVLSAVLTFVLAMGQMTTKGAVKNTKLDPAPIDQCPAFGGEGVMGNFTLTNETMVAYMLNATTEMTSLLMTTVEIDTYPPEPTGIRRVFMLSYKWLAPVGILLVVIFGTIISFCTGYMKPGEVDRKYVIPFYDSLFPFLPECLLKPLRCGYTYETTEERIEEDKENIGKEDAHTMYNRLDDHDKEMFDIKFDVKCATAENHNNITTNGDVKGATTENHVIIATNGDVKHNCVPSDVAALLKSMEAPTTDVSLSVDDLRGRVPVKDIEIDIMKGATSDEFIVTDRSEDIRLLKFKAKSEEFLVTPEDLSL